MSEIRVKPDELESQGRDLNGFAQDLEEILSNIDSKINEIIESWDGMAQDGYYNMYSTMKESLNQFPKLVDSLGDATISAAQAFANVDEQLQSSFNSAM